MGSSVTGLISDRYTVSVTDANMCAKNETIDVGEDTCQAIIIHNAITPTEMALTMYG